MNLLFNRGRGESAGLGLAKQAVLVAAAFFAAIALVCSMLVLVPNAQAAPNAGNGEVTESLTDEGATGEADESSQPSLTTTSTTENKPEGQGESSEGGQAEPTTSATASPVNWADKYATKLEFISGGAVLDENSMPKGKVFKGSEFKLKYYWAVGDHEKPKPGDLLIIDLPNWLNVRIHKLDFTAGEYKTCDIGYDEERNNAAKRIVCRFTDAVVGKNSLNLRGDIEFDVAAVVVEKAEEISWGPHKVDGYYYRTGEKGGPVGKYIHPADKNVKSGDFTKTGKWSFAYNYPNNGDPYVQYVWEVVIPADKIGQSNTFTVEDTFTNVEFEDPFTGEKVSLPQYVAPATQGQVTIARRTGAAAEKGYWKTYDNSVCKGDGDYVHAEIPCADRVAFVDAATLAVTNGSGNKGEVVTVEGVTGGTKSPWEKNNKINITVKNPIADSAYLVEFFSVIPAAKLDSLNNDSPKHKNTATVNGTIPVVSNEVRPHVKVGGHSYGDPNKADLIIRKKLDGPDGVTSDKDRFDIRYTINGKEGTCTTSVAQPCWIKNIDKDAKVTVEEPAVTGSQFKWEPGVFAGERNKGKDILIDGNKASIEALQAGERVVLTVTNSYAKATGSLLIKKDVQGLADKELLKDDIEVDYICVPAGQPTDNVPPKRVKVPTNGDVKEIKDISVGHECLVQENVSSAEVGVKYGINVTYSPEGGKVTIKQGQGENNSNLVTITNKYTLNAAPIFLKKVVTGERPEGLNDDTEFTVKYQCDNDSADGKVKANQPTELKLKAKGDPVTGPEFPLDTKCKVVDEAKDKPKFEDFNFTAELGGEITVSNDAEASTLVVTNTFKKDEAKLRVTKAVSGDAGALAGEKEFTFKYTCGADSGELKVKGNGFAETEKTFPVGTECTVTELGVEPDGSAQIHNHILTVAPEVVQRVVVGKDEGAKYTNNYAVKKGKFGVAKKAEGENGKAAEREFVFDYTCGAETGQVRARGNGLVIEAPVELPVGTECTVTESKSAVEIADYDFLTPDDQLTKTVTVREGETAVAEFVNTYARQLNKFKVEKVVKVVDGAVAPATFDFDYKCVLGEDTITGEILGVPANGSGESAEIPTNYVCTVTERDAKVVGATLVTEIGDGVKIVAKQPDGVASIPVIKVDNIYTKDLGEFTITKKLVDPDGIAAGKTFDFKYVCTPPADRAGEAPIEGVLTVAAGASATSPKIPAGFNCEVKEVGAEIVDSNLVTTGLDATLVITKDGTTPVEVTNTYSQWKGALKVSKQILGIKADSKLLKDHEFEAAFKCVKNDKTTNEGSIKVKAGETVTVDNIVANSVCTVTEKLDSTKVSSLRFQPELSTTEVTAEKITVDGGSTDAKLLNSYVELGHFAITKELGGLTGEAAGKDREFHMIAIWTDNGVETTKEFTIRAGQVYKEFPELPVGTKVTLKERHPGNGVFVQWHTPGFTSDRAGAIVDHHDGTAELTIVADSPADKPQLVTLTNTGNPPWWWALVPLAILGGGGGSSNGSSTSAPQSTTPQAPAQAKSSNAPASLARTGASVLGVVALAGLAVAAGVFLVRRGRNNS